MNIVEFISCLQARAAALEAVWSLLSMSTVDEAKHAHVGHTKVPLQVGDLGQYLIHGSVGYRESSCHWHFGQFSYMVLQFVSNRHTHTRKSIFSLKT